MIIRVLMCLVCAEMGLLPSSLPAGGVDPLPRCAQCFNEELHVGRKATGTEGADATLPVHKPCATTKRVPRMPGGAERGPVRQATDVAQGS